MLCFVQIIISTSYHTQSYGVSLHFQQYFSYIVKVSFIGGENHRHVVSHWQSLSYNVVLSTPRLSWIQTHNVSGDRQ